MNAASPAPGRASSRAALAEAIADLPLVDDHVHGALRDDPLDTADFSRHIAETDRPAPPGTTWFDTLLGVSLRRWCAPLLDIAPDAHPDTYFSRRVALGAEEVTRRMLHASGITHYLLDTGYRGGEIHGLDGMRQASGVAVDEVVRLETTAEEVAASGTNAEGFADAFTQWLHERTVHAVGTKSVAAYRYGLNLAPDRPTTREVADAAGTWLRRDEGTGRWRVDDPVLLRFLVWAALDRGLPLQFHTGMGDPDLHLARADPTCLTDLIKAAEPTKTEIVLLHCYPFHRNAAYLSRMFTYVSMDVGEALNYVGARAPAVVAETLEVVPFHKLMFSSDAWGPAELHYLGALQWRRAMTRVLSELVDDDELSVDQALAIAGQVASGTARRVYRLPNPA